MSFAGTRTYHRMAVRIEDAGFEIRDMIFWTYASGFPKSTNIFKQLKKLCTCGIMEAYEKEAISGEPNTKHDLRPVSKANLSQTINLEKEQGEVLQSELQEQSISLSRDTTSNEGERQPSVERGNNSKKTEGELQGSDIPKMSEEVSTNGEERRLHNATQIGDGSTFEQITGKNRGDISQRPQSEQQQDREPCAFCKQYGTQAMGAFGWGSALKPACEPISVCRKPLSEKTIAENVLKWGTGGINIDGCRIGTADGFGGWAKATSVFANGYEHDGFKESTQGRFPTNLLHDGSDEVVSLFPNTRDGKYKAPNTRVRNNGLGLGTDDIRTGSSNAPDNYGDSGSASRFFYCAKSSKSERNAGCEELDLGEVKHYTKNRRCKICGYQEVSGSPCKCENPEWEIIERPVMKGGNTHPTVKPIVLMEYLVKLVSREGAVVLDPFAGSGTTGIACINLGRKYILIEKEPNYVEIMKHRLKQVSLF